MRDASFLSQKAWPTDQVRMMIERFMNQEDGTVDKTVIQMLTNEGTMARRIFPDKNERIAHLLARCLQVILSSCSTIGALGGWRNVALILRLLADQFDSFADEREKALADSAAKGGTNDRGGPLEQVSEKKQDNKNKH